MANEDVKVDHFLIYPTKSDNLDGGSAKPCAIDKAKAWAILAVTEESEKIHVALVNDDMNLTDVLGRLLEAYEEADQKVRTVWLDEGGEAHSTKLAPVDDALSQISALPTQSSALGEGRMAQLRKAFEFKVREADTPTPG
ncbi:MAG: hypothetical protein ABJN42_13690 [Roseibium sp.]|uniref:hypothetical protein n=1 Tax=Roseibium sp. TaxID=1936156 RepID=UPI003298C3C3